jgi:RimJ/RimL family protein N-acetyltransferase
MRHDISLTGYAFNLRPIGVEDAELIVRLRGDATRTRDLKPITPDVATQRKYLEGYFQKEGDYYFVIERLERDGGASEGLVGIYNLDEQQRRAEWGRWVIQPQSLAAVESAWLVYRVGFEVLDLEAMYCRTLVRNAPVVSFHDLTGLERSRRIEACTEIDGETCDAIEHVLRRDRWPLTAEKLEPRAKRLALRLRGTDRRR